MTFVIPFPNIDPVLIGIGPFAIRWYSLAYIAGLLLGWLLLRRLAKRAPKVADEAAVDDFLVWATLGVILGGRLGYVVFYNFAYYFEHPLAVFAVWRGGMSFHGGLIGVIVATLIFCRRRGIDLWPFADRVACVAPVGLFFGRMANFINGELWGKPTDVPWAFNINGVGLHPSQLYEAALEGFLLFAILWIYSAKPRPQLAVSGMFLLFYGVFRFGVEFYRVPDAHLDYLALGWVTMGQILSAPMIIIGALLLILAYRNKQEANA